MPIRPENRARYPADWSAIRRRILERAGHRCEACGVPNYAFRRREPAAVTTDPDEAAAWRATGTAVTRIVLTISHRDHQPEHNDEANLRALCQRCHLAYDRDHHRATRQRRRT